MEGGGPQANDALRPGEIAGAIAWWRDAGVDSVFSDEPRKWLADHDEPAAAKRISPRAVVAPNQPAPEEPRIGGDRANWPNDLSAFQDWWLAEPLLDEGAVRARVPPLGPAEAQLMIVVAQPEAEDSTELLSGSQGRLLSAFLAAAGVAPEAVYLASALPRHTPAPDWATLARRGLGNVLLHHIGLVRPVRLLVFGENVLPLLGNDPAQTAQNSRQLYHEGQTISLLGSRDLGSLARPAWKARLWREWLDWTGT